MKSAFRAALEEHFEPNRGHPQHEHWRDYALSSLDRGRELIDKLEREFTGALRGRRHLDVGSGYGGTCLAAARGGASSLGIEIGQAQLRLAETLLDDEPGLDLRFASLDVMEWDQLSRLGRFDVITCESVIEHVRIPDRLLAHLRRLLAPGGLLYLTVPNAFAVEQVRADCHYGLPGVTLLDPWDSEAYVREELGNASYDVSLYYNLSTYEHLLRKYGFTWKLLNPVQGTDEEIAALAAAVQGLREAVGARAVPAAIAAKLSDLLDVYVGRWQTDLAFLRHAQLADAVERDRFAKTLVRDYGLELWYIAAFAAADPEPVARRTGWSAAVRRVVPARRPQTAGHTDGQP